jgi:NADPH:quinone reductase-like Zn-dependent oxidoreductase
MKAAFRTTYGNSSVLSVKELETPIPKSQEVLIRVHAATVNRTDCHVLWGKPPFMRLLTGLSRPKLATTGCDFAGKIVAVGEEITSFKVGDKVMGFGGVLGCGSHAEFLLLSESQALKAMVSCPEDLSYEDAAACIEGAFYAQGGIRYLNPKAGQKALVIGATGAIGSATVQLLCSYGVEVTAVCRGQNAALVKSIGAGKVIDFEKENYEIEKDQYDYIFDAVGVTRFGRCKHLLTEKGVFTSSGGDFNHIWLSLITPLKGGKKVMFRPPGNVPDGLNFIKEEIRKGKFKPVIDRKYPLDKIAEAFDYVGTRQKIGNVTLTM